jgi:phenylalanyl-tRNA synthetase alpha chain
MERDLKNLHPLEIRLLREVKPGEEMDTGRVMKALSFNTGQANQVFSWLSAKGLIRETARREREFYEITPYGRSQQQEGTAEERILGLLKSRSLKLPEIAGLLGLENKDAGSAFGALAKEGLAAMDGEKNIIPGGETTSPRLALIREILNEAAAGAGVLDGDSLPPEKREVLLSIAKKRGAGTSCFRIAGREEVTWVLSEEGVRVRKELEELGLRGDELGALTPELLASGEWKNKTLRGYNIHSPAVRVLLGRKNPYGEYLQWVKDKLVSLGFEEFDGPLVETEFWNGDALFMPQFHSARDIHDVYYVKEPSHIREIEQPWLDRVAAAHENGGESGSRGWGYAFDRDFTRRLVLRSQGTVLSAKQLTKAKVPGKYFGILRCFRYDQVDATHGADFYQTEGIILGEDVNLRTLLGLLKMFAEEVAGAEEVKYVPGYFPFTEPSIEIHIKHPRLGWFELGGSGIFRPELCEALGVKVPVLAWGLGIDRMALMHLDLNDLRELFSSNIENVRLRRSR